MGGPDGVVEVSCIGPTAVTLSKQIPPLLWKAVHITNLKWDSGRQSLSHGNRCVVNELSEDCVQEVLWSYSAFNSLPTATNWSRVNVGGYIYEVGVVEDDERRPGHVVRDCLITNDAAEGLRVRLITLTELTSEEGTSARIHLSRVNIGGRCIHADTSDLAGVEVLPSNSPHSGIASVGELSWQRSS